VIAAKQATSIIPIVFAAAGDPVGNKLVASLARPGANVTGLSIQQALPTSTRAAEGNFAISSIHATLIHSRLERTDISYRAERSRHGRSFR
jgi:hypothetical protein